MRTHSADAEREAVDHPPHYTSHASGVECVQITECLSFNLGNAVKYAWRASLKGGLQDLEKAAWYLRRELARPVVTPLSPTVDPVVLRRLVAAVMRHEVSGGAVSPLASVLDALPECRRDAVEWASARIEAEITRRKAP